MKLLLFRVDSSSRIGVGHIMRCFALAQAWQLSGGQAVFLSYCESDALKNLISDSGMEFIPIEYPHPDPRDLQSTLEILQKRSTNDRSDRLWVALDGYHFDAIYQESIRIREIRLLVIDDMAHLPCYRADILLNQNLNAKKLFYNHESETILLLGLQYALLRQQFLVWRDCKKEIPDKAYKVLITMGGSDPENVTLKIIHALAKVTENTLETIVVIGDSNPHYDMLLSEILNLPQSIRIERCATNMPELMAWADVAISAGGSTIWEYVFMGLPIITLAIAENQLNIVEQVEALGISVNLGWHQQVTESQIAQSLISLLDSAERRNSLARRCHAQVDGNGADRVCAQIHGSGIRLRNVREEDKFVIWEWANAPEVRAASFSKDKISWEQHSQWFEAKQKDPNCVFYIALSEAETPLGQVRYDIDGEEATISISIDAKFRGRGFGQHLITLSTLKLCKELPVKTIHAYVKERNETSTQAFLNAKFIEDILIYMNGEPTRHLILINKGIV